MSNCNSFIQHSDYKALGNDAEGEVSLEIPDTFSIPANGGRVVFSSKLDIGTKNAPIICKISSSKRSGYISPSSLLIVFADRSEIDYKGNHSDMGIVSGLVLIRRVNNKTISLECHFNAEMTPAEVFVSGARQTITAKIRTFTSPFKN